MSMSLAKEEKHVDIIFFILKIVSLGLWLVFRDVGIIVRDDIDNCCVGTLWFCAEDVGLVEHLSDVVLGGFD